MVSRKKRLWALSVAALVVGPAAAQVKFAQMTAPEYLTYCASAASGEILTPGCSNSYQQLTDVVQAVLSDPRSFGEHHLGQLNSLCAPTPDSGPSCVTQLQNMADAYVEGLPTPSPQVARKDTCEGTLAPNAKPFFDTFMPFTCLSDGHGGSCLVQVAQALQEAGAWCLLREGEAQGCELGWAPVTLGLSAVSHAPCAVASPPATCLTADTAAKMGTQGCWTSWCR